jgi:calcium/calmodulin-dependent protein kinase I
MEQMDGGSLSSLLHRKGKLNEAEAITVMKGVLEGLQYIHLNGYIHRDIKPENILLAKENDLSTVHIADFGLGAKLEAWFGQNKNKLCGTMIYMAPEQATSDNYSQNVDTWACGMMLYILLTGKHPLYNIESDTQLTYLDKLKDPQWKFPSSFGDLAKKLFLKCCTTNNVNRYDIINALQHPWITRYPIKQKSKR